MAPATSSSTTSSKPFRTRYYGSAKQPKAERRLKRHLANRELQLATVQGAFGVVNELLRTAGLGLGILVVDVLYRAGVLSITATRAFYALFSVSAAADIVSAITRAFPFSSDASERNAAQPTGEALTEAAAVSIPPAGQISKVPLQPEFL